MLLYSIRDDSGYPTTKPPLLSMRYMLCRERNIILQLVPKRGAYIASHTSEERYTFLLPFNVDCDYLPLTLFETKISDHFTPCLLPLMDPL